MTTNPSISFRQAPLELELTALIAAPRDVIWRCWTEPELLKQWYCPKPWRVEAVDSELRPGGRMNIIMAGPDGERIELFGIWLEIIEPERMTFTDFYTEDFIPQDNAFMTGYVRLEDAATEEGVPEMTRVIWGARHRTEAETTKHLEMGFEAGWSAALGQLAELARSVQKAA